MQPSYLIYRVVNGHRIADAAYRTRMLTVRVSNAATGDRLARVTDTFLPTNAELPKRPPGPKVSYIWKPHPPANTK